MSLKAKFPKLFAFLTAAFGGSVEVKADETAKTVELSEEQLTKIDAELAQVETLTAAKADLETKLVAAEKAVNDAKAELTDVKGKLEANSKILEGANAIMEEKLMAAGLKLDEAEAKEDVKLKNGIEKLGGLPGAATTAAAKKEDVQPDADRKDDFLKFDHNKEANEQANRLP